MYRLINKIEKTPKFGLLAITLTVTFVLGFVDYVTGTELTFYQFYAIPVMFAVWFAGRWRSYPIAIISLFFWVADDFYKRNIFGNPLISLWNLLVQMFFFVLLIEIFSALKLAFKEQKKAEQEKIKNEMKVARQVQEKLFPQFVPVSSLDFHGICKTADAVGGDYFDYFKIRNNEIAFAIGDVSGHGLSAALIMAGLVGFVRSSASVFNENLGEFFKRLNNLIFESTAGSNFISFFYGIVREEDKVFRYINAGQNPPMVYRPCTDTFVQLKTGGLLMGIKPDWDYETGTIKLESGDIIILYTDGITETFNSENEMFGEERLKYIIKKYYINTSSEIMDYILDGLDRFSNRLPQKDDITLLVIKIN